MKIHRLLGIIIYLLNHEVASSRLLAEKFEVSRRTIQRDIDAINLAGIPIVSIQGSPEVREKVAMQREPEISFNYMSSFDREINTELFEKSDLAMGPYIDPQSNRRFKLDINVYLIDGCLSVEIEYNKKQYHQETIQRLGTEFENQLKDIVKHCSESGQNTIHTPSDFGARDLSINDFDEIMNMLDQ